MADYPDSFPPNSPLNYSGCSPPGGRPCKWLQNQTFGGFERTPPRPRSDWGFKSPVSSSPEYGSRTPSSPEYMSQTPPSSPECWSPQAPYSPEYGSRTPSSPEYMSQTPPSSPEYRSPTPSSPECWSPQGPYSPEYGSGTPSSPESEEGWTTERSPDGSSLKRSRSYTDPDGTYHEETIEEVDSSACEGGGNFFNPSPRSPSFYGAPSSSPIPQQDRSSLPLEDQSINVAELDDQINVLLNLLKDKHEWQKLELLEMGPNVPERNESPVFGKPVRSSTPLDRSLNIEGCDCSGSFPSDPFENTDGCSDLVKLKRAALEALESKLEAQKKMISFYRQRMGSGYEGDISDDLTPPHISESVPFQGSCSPQIMGAGTPPYMKSPGPSTPKQGPRRKWTNPPAGAKRNPFGARAPQYDQKRRKQKPIEQKSTDILNVGQNPADTAILQAKEDAEKQKMENALKCFFETRRTKLSNTDNQGPSTPPPLVQRNRSQKIESMSPGVRQNLFPQQGMMNNPCCIL